MSGGYISEQESGDHQVVIFTFSGKITKEQCDEWNAACLRFKSRTFKPVGALTGVTIRGETTPARYRPKKPAKKRT
jgi:hypothetical protein